MTPASILKLLFPLLFFGVFLDYAEASKAPICTEIEYSSIWYYCSNNDSYLAYSINMQAALNPNNITFPNTIIFSNYVSWESSWPELIKTPLTYSYISSDHKVNIPMSWDLLTQQYIFSIPNVDGYLDLGVFINNVFVDHKSIDESYANTFVNNGEIFINYSPLANPASPCINVEISDCNYWPFFYNHSICCKNFTYIDVPDLNGEICQTFSSTFKATGELQATLNATYKVYSDKINMNVTYFNSPSDLEYSVDLKCSGYNSDPYSNCDFFISKNDDFQFHFTLELERIFPLIGILIRRNGIFLKDDNTLFTSSNPCWEKDYTIPYGNSVSVETSFCCTSFTTAAATTTISPATITPPFTVASSNPPTPGFCLKYSSRTMISDNSTFLEVDYKLNSTGINVHITNYFASKDSRVQLEAYSTDIFSQTCSATTANPDNNCFFQLSITYLYELQIRTTFLPDGFNMLTISENNGQFTTPLLTSANPCTNETNPYNYGNSNLYATTKFCCTAFAS